MYLSSGSKELPSVYSTVVIPRDLQEVAQAHTNYQVSMIAEELIGLMNIDNLANITYPVTGNIIRSFTL
jgi:hypothetical protein